MEGLLKERKTFRLAGFLGLAACLIAALEFPAWMVHGAARSLMDLAIIVLLLFFFAILRKAIIDRRADLEWMATLLFGLSLVYIAITLVADALSGSMRLDAGEGKADPVVLRAMVESTLPLLGSAGLTLIGAMMLISGVINAYARIFPAWFSYFSFLVCALDFAFVPSMFFGADPSSFYSAGGLGPALAATFPFLAWIAIASLFMIGRRHRPAGGR
jgi:hypothetical protein